MAAIRFRVFKYCQDQSPLKGKIEVDKSYFGARGKIIVLGLLKRQGKVYSEIIHDCSTVVLQKFIRGKVDVGSIIHSYGWRGYNGL